MSAPSMDPIDVPENIPEDIDHGEFEIQLIHGWSKKELELLLSRRGLEVKGKKPELAARLIEALESAPIVPDAIDQAKTVELALEVQHTN